MSAETDFQVVKMRRLDGSSKLKAFADVSIGAMIVKGFRLVEGKDGLFVGLPQERSKDGKWYDTVEVPDKRAYRDLSEIIITAYQE